VTSTFPARKLESLGDHGILLARNIRIARATEIENTVYVSCCLATRKIACDQAAKILCERHPEIIGAHGAASQFQV
jgi:hypothetical protein